MRLVVSAVAKMWIVVFSVVTPSSLVVIIIVSEKHIASIFSSSLKMKATGLRSAIIPLDVTSQITIVKGK
jgi:hypothetical protein